ISGEEEVLRDVHVLLCEIHRAAGDMESARAHFDQASALRDQVADSLPTDVRAAFLAQRAVAELGRLQGLIAAASPDRGGDMAEVEEPAPRTLRSVRPSVAVPRDLIGNDPAIRGLIAAVKKVARSNSTVLIRGESGTGKELVAEALHRASDRANGPM